MVGAFLQMTPSGDIGNDKKYFDFLEIFTVNLVQPFVLSALCDVGPLLHRPFVVSAHCFVGLCIVGLCHVGHLSFWPFVMSTPYDVDLCHIGHLFCQPFVMSALCNVGPFVFSAICHVAPL